jgi:glycosyltransferase involved in cell wall biosynthesis
MKISVYITSYNQKQYLIEAIESVLAQTYPPHQIIIVDDTSTDGSQEVISGYANRHPDLISTIFHAENMGVAHTRNDALRAVSGDYVTYLDGDDRYLPDKLEKEARILQKKSKAQICYSNVYIINPTGKRIDIWANRPPPQGNVFCQTFARDFPRKRLFRNELIHYPSWKQVGFHDTHLNLYEDYEMRIRLTKTLRVAYTDEPLIEYRRHSSGLSRVKTNRYLIAFDYLCEKNLHLLEDLNYQDQKFVRRKLKEWKAALIRRKSREVLFTDTNFFRSRIKALSHYRKSLNYHFYIDIKFWLHFLLPNPGFSMMQSILNAIQLARYSRTT